MAKLFYITRTFTHNGQAGGALMREGAVNQFIKHGFDIEVVTYGSSVDIDTVVPEHVTLIDGTIRNLKCNLYMQRLGLLEDYLTSWANNVVQYLQHKVSDQDIVFCSTGGDLASLMAGCQLKQRCGCKYIANFRDPVSHTRYGEHHLERYTHVNRDALLQKYVSNADLVVTSCNSYKDYLQSVLSVTVVNNHFGYLSQSDYVCDFELRQPFSDFKLIYAGTLSKYQGHKKVADTFRQLDNVSLDIYGHNKTLVKNMGNVRYFQSVSRDLLAQKMIHDYDAGFVSLDLAYFGACIPSKIYEYINIGLPIFGFLPQGEARDIINDNGYGYIATTDNIAELRRQMSLIANNQDKIVTMNKNLLKDRLNWSMESKFNELVKYINEI